MMRIVGTAGHVDHGKSALVAALTGTDPDRWAEEQLRGMTLDLGFAHLILEGAPEAGIVDVPGHERFLHNMLAGAAGMDVLLLVISAVEGVMPQTVEHLDILGYLNVRKTIVVMTKADLVDAQRLRDVDSGYGRSAARHDRRRRAVRRGLQLNGPRSRRTAGSYRASPQRTAGRATRGRRSIFRSTAPLRSTESVRS